MRDLARTGLFSRKKSVSGRKRLKLLGILIAIGVVSYFVGNYQPAPAQSTGPVVLRDAPGNLPPVSLTGIDLAAAEGVTLSTGTAVMKDVRYGGEAQAQVTRAYGAGIYKLDINATLPDPVNVPYAVWLVGGNGVPVLIDYMKGEGTSWSYNLSGADKFSNLDGVIISLERTKDNKVEEKILEGSF